jgi:amino acid transporter
VGIGLFYALSSWAIVMAWGVDDIVAVAGEDPEGLLFATTERYLGPVAGVAVQVLLITSLLACVISFHNVVARYFHALGSAGALPVSLGRRHGAHGSPHIASVSQTVLIVLILAAMILLGLDPVLEIFTWLSGSTTLGALVLMALTCIAVIVYFRRTRVDRRAWQTVIAPSLGMIGLAVILAVVIANLPTLVGGSVAVALVIGAVIVVCLVAGLVVAGVLRTRRPAAYAKLIESIAP